MKPMVIRALSDAGSLSDIQLTQYPSPGNTSILRCYPISPHHPHRFLEWLSVYNLAEMKSLTVLLTNLMVLAVLVLVGFGTAHAKPNIAVLGLEVIDNGSVDKKATQAAQDLAAELRSQAAHSNSKYKLAPGGPKDLLELKLLSDCGDEGRTCMTVIGKELGADRLLYGKIERRKKGYQVSLKLLNTNTKQMEKTTSELIPTEDLHGGNITKWARSLYARLIGVPESGELRLDANVDSATVYIDDKVATTLRDGSAKVVGLDEGVHTVAIEADGYERYEADVAITAGVTESLTLSLTSLKSTESGGEESDGSGWTIAFAGSAVVTTGLVGGWAYNGYQFGFLGFGGELTRDKEEAWQDLYDANRMAYDAIKGEDRGATIDDSCGKTNRYVGDPDPSFVSFIDACKAGEDAAKRATIFLVASSVSALATAYLGYQAVVVHGGKSNKEDRRTSKRKRKNRLMVTPQISGDSLGAGLSLEF